MMQSLRQMVTCRWSARRIQRYLDADPAAPLTPGEIARLEAHLAVCERCQQLETEHRSLRRLLAGWRGRSAPDVAAVARLRTFVDTVSREEQS